VASENTRRVADLLFGIAAEETDESDSVEVHTILLFCLCVSGTRQASGRGSQTQKLLFWGNRHGGARTGTVPEAKQRLRRRRAPQEPRSSAETTGGTGNGPETVTISLSKPPKMQREIVVVLPIGLESTPHLRAAATRHRAKNRNDGCPATVLGRLSLEEHACISPSASLSEGVLSQIRAPARSISLISSDVRTAPR
jgi:hypothetical protein